MRSCIIENMEDKTKKRHYGGWIFLLILIVVGVGVYLNREWLYDYYRGMTYQPSSEMARIRNDLQLTERGEFLFNASQPVLSEAVEFNQYCRDGVSEIAVLGCYTDRSIYIYNIVDADLDGIRELTTAHELLHANWARMSEDEQRALTTVLTQTFEANQDLLTDELENYNVSERQEELYVRAGTEVANLPTELERHYAEFFKDQDAVVRYYNAYIGVFKNLQAEMDNLQAEMEGLRRGIDDKTAEYERRIKQLDADIMSFNSCARVMGCFETEEEFNVRRGALLSEQTALEGLYDEINNSITSYNEKVELYNADVAYGERLNTIINSTARPQEIK